MVRQQINAHNSAMRSPLNEHENLLLSKVKVSIVYTLAEITFFVGLLNGNYNHKLAPPTEIRTQLRNSSRFAETNSGAGTIQLKKQASLSGLHTMLSTVRYTPWRRFNHVHCCVRTTRI